MAYNRLDIKIKPKVTVLMPVYNGERYLAEAMKSILNQSFTDFEFLIINDGSTDRTLEIASSFEDHRVQVVSNTRNEGLIAALNRGLALAQGEYIARMDQDDISLPMRLEKQVSFMDAHDDIGVLGTAFQLIDKEGTAISMPVIFPRSHHVLTWSLFYYSPFVHPSVMFRKITVVAAGGYSARATHAEDYDLWFRLSRLTRLSNLPDILILLRKHDTNITTIYLNEHLSGAVLINKPVIDVYLDQDIPFDLIHKLMTNSTGTLDDALNVGRLITGLHRAFIRRNMLSREDRKAVDRDMANRIIAIIRPYLGFYRSWGIYCTTVYYHPVLLKEATDYIKNRIKHAVRRYRKPIN